MLIETLIIQLYQNELKAHFDIYPARAGFNADTYLKCL